MSLELVLRGIGGEDANKLADAWHDYEREQQRRFDALGVEVSKAINRSTASVTLASLTPAALLAGSLYVGVELGGLKQSAVSLSESVR